MADEPFNGLILDIAMKPVKKVKVYVKDPKKYATTDKKGRFGLTNVNPNDTLTLVFKNKEEVRIPVDGRKSVKILLTDNFDVAEYSQDDELVNLGYGYVKRREFTGVSNGISGDRLRATGQRSVIRALAGLVPGLNVNNVYGEPEVTIRGQRSFMLSNAPLYLVDGVQVESLDMISVYDVDHVEVIKDASQYGARGANGAILVTTKAGMLNR
ncbi:MAG: TonB-dependent receptor plug domain-containing protein [Duncaniella sp.]|nr:TonB-dependent receptor plug domain-containing protein [Muribaculum sp.]MCM1255073.1 TonB-dependent receptor plug domain-containing protein [Duncaniella sp.]